MEAMSKATNQNAELWIPVPNDTSTMQLLNLSLRGYCGRLEQKDCKNWRKRQFAVKLVMGLDSTEVPLSCVLMEAISGLSRILSP